MNVHPYAAADHEYDATTLARHQIFRTSSSLLPAIGAFWPLSTVASQQTLNFPLNIHLNV